MSNNNIIKTVNFIQKTPLSININMLNYILTIIEKNILLEEPIFFKQHDLTNDLRNGKILDEDQKFLILRHNTLAAKNYRTISAALLLKDHDFYCPMYIDWRGRMYTLNNLLSYQGDELTKSLLYFSSHEAETLNLYGLKHLKIYIANCYGLNKKSYIDRLHWVEKNLTSIINLDCKLIESAKDKLLFVAACFELKQYYLDPDNFKTRLPIFIDATCNGIQHLSSIVGDLNLANLVNLTMSSSEDVPNDIYEEMSKLVKNSTKFSH